MKKLFGILVLILLTGCNNAVQTGVWFETAWATWPVTEQTDYKVYTSRAGGEWQAVDHQLVRVVDHQWRVDVLGLANTGDSYRLRIEPNPNRGNAFISKALKPVAFDRQGYAFALNALNDTSRADGAYLSDGTLDPNAEVIYVNQDNMDEMLDPVRFVNNEGSNPTPNQPLVIRVLGRVGKVGPVVTDKRTEGWTPLAAGDAPFMLVVRNARHITLEGVGPDAEIVGWGIRYSRVVDGVIRNLTFDQYYDDAVHLEGGSHADSSNLWVVHNTFKVGQNRFAVGLGEYDHQKGDGSSDVTGGITHITLAYNHYIDSNKSSLQGGSITQLVGHITFHHNWLEETSERTPRLRNGWNHVFNNLYDNVGGEPGDGSGYGIAAGHRANIVAEGNSFIHTYRPFLISGQGSAFAAGQNPTDSSANTLSNDAPGAIITSLQENHQELTGRVLVANSLDDFSSNREWFDPELDLGANHSNMIEPFEAVMESSPNFGKFNGGRARTSHQFIAFDSDRAYPNPGNIITTGIWADSPEQAVMATVVEPAVSPNFPEGWRPQVAINQTLSKIGVENAADSAKRVRNSAGVMASH